MKFAMRYYFKWANCGGDFSCFFEILFCWTICVTLLLVLLVDSFWLYSNEFKINWYKTKISNFKFCKVFLWFLRGSENSWFCDFWMCFAFFPFHINCLHFSGLNSCKIIIFIQCVLDDSMKAKTSNFVFSWRFLNFCLQNQLFRH